MSLVRRLLFVVALAMVASGCIGATSRSEFNDEVRRRGGGVSNEWVIESLTLVAGEVGAAGLDELDVLAATVDPDNRSVTVTARRADNPVDVDIVSVYEGEISSVSPMQNADQLPLESLVMPVAGTPLTDVQGLADAALEAFGEPESYVTRIRLQIVLSQPELLVDVESARRTAVVHFDQAGELVEVER